MKLATVALVIAGALAPGVLSSAERDGNSCAGFHEPTQEYWQTVETDEVTACSEGGSVDVRTSNGETALHLTAAFNADEMVADVLLQSGANPRARTKGDMTPLHMLAEHDGNPAVVAKLVLYGADVNARKDLKEGYFNDSGITPLHLAAEHDESGRVVAALLAAGASTELINHGGRTALHKASRYMPSRVVEVLLAGGADSNADDEDGWTPLHLAATYNNSHLVIERLLQAGADAGAESETDPPQNALKLAAEKTENPRVFGLLIEATPEPCAAYDAGRTALDLAEENAALVNTPEYWDLFEICRE